KRTPSILAGLALSAITYAQGQGEPITHVSSTQPDSLAWMILGLLVWVAYVLVVWGRVFVRAGYPRWDSLVILLPLFNLFAIGKRTREAGYSGWWMLLILVPLGLVFWSFKLAYAEEWPAEKRKHSDRAVLKYEVLPD
ncbi:MAG TPA: hypothetical protein VKE93_11850, partial [Candidatus Angelobacter sp.]|nr:hypothetical protein [Candidatus Angelobacter sp.]